jgi:hypothetical protein
LGQAQNVVFDKINHLKRAAFSLMLMHKRTQTLNLGRMGQVTGTFLHRFWCKKRMFPRESAALLHQQNLP